ncbi:MAG: CocE/NonD family hydrolase [Deferrisomatales bacterium]|nr:CocE/NonD family hydrolase [Deferrisomatales bacterium]
MKHDFEYRLREPLSSPEELGGHPPRYERRVEGGVLIERDVAVAMRDGVRIFVDVFRPVDEARPVPPLIAWGPYGKHGPTRMAKQFPKAGITAELSTYTAFEAPDPLHWVAQGYAVLNVDPRGTWFSEGTATYLSPEEARDEYDLIEWAGTQPWSNGKVGLIGVSYLASSQWGAAATNPPHLAAINPWEGWSDSYREVVRHGGIPETSFWPYLPGRWGRSKTRIEDLERETREHPLLDGFWEAKRADLSKITVPAYVVASWTDQGLHTRGTLEGFKKISSPHKWLEVHGRKKWAYFYEPESVRRQQVFFDHFLKGVETEVAQWPRVRLEARQRYYVGEFRSEAEWPVARTRYTKLHLDARDGSLRPDPAPAEASCSYSAEYDADESVRFDVRFDRRTDLIGHTKLRLWLAPHGADDADVFVVLQKLDAAGQVVPFAFYAQFEDGPVALGWLRASHRELDPDQATEQQPVLLHRREQKLVDGEIVPLEIEVWPSGTRFEAGEGLRLVMRGSDFKKPEVEPPVGDALGDLPKTVRRSPLALHEDSVNRGRHVIHTGGQYDSYLMVPVVAG